ncbi:hypothetical protein [Sphingomonas sp. BAUL-RG-20F-R05-02]|uniref:hypothetical protein n=1 Tax=Sphingomonas sp. BAUL-RG-20F-R05-02 TaxID=2914830 RepID=UPI001F5A7C0A|nr:hypothetical protein [Sphingomonas sp. BAUL-RG-20F-R05-02]
MSTSYETALLELADAYQAEVDTLGGKSLARVATIVVNRGSFFERLRDGGGCSARNLDRFADWFRDAANWPCPIPSNARAALASVGRPVICSSVEKLVHVATDTVSEARDHG